MNNLNTLHSFLNQNNGTQKVIAIQGLGFVGSVMMLVCANSLQEDYLTIGVDLDNPTSNNIINSINNGQFPITADDPNIDLFFTNAKLKNNIFATSNSDAYSFADIIIVDVNLDVQKKSNENNSLANYDVDLSSFKKAISTIGEKCKKDVLILVETTVPPGTCKNIVYPILCKKFEERGLSTNLLKVAHSYERVMPGPDYINSIRNYPRVYSGINEKSAIAAESFLKTIIDTSICELTRLESTTATEMAKVLENSYRASNIAFAVEWSRFAEEAGVNLWEVVNAIRVRKTHSNLMYPGIGVGGYCLTKDPLLASWARMNFFEQSEELSISVRSVSTNDQMPVFAYQRLKKVFGSLHSMRVLFLGVSYRGNVGDSRFSPVETLYKLVRSDDTSIKLHDPYIQYWQELSCEVDSDIDIVLEPSPDLIIISTSHSEYKDNKIINKIMALNPSKIFDTVGLLSEEQILKLKIKHEVSVLGRGETT